MGPFTNKFIGDVARTVGKALLAGVGMELAKVIGEHIRRRVGPKPDATAGSAHPVGPGSAGTDDAHRAAEVERLRMENARLRDELAAPRAAPRGADAFGHSPHNG